MPENGNDGPRVYEVRLAEPAEAEIDDIYLRLLSRVSLAFADRWRDGLLQALDSLSVFPTSHPVTEAESRRVGREIRRLLYRQGRTVHKVLFTLMDADDDGETDTVRVLHIRHASQADPDHGTP